MNARRERSRFGRTPCELRLPIVWSDMFRFSTRFARCFLGIWDGASMIHGKIKTHVVLIALVHAIRSEVPDELARLVTARATEEGTTEEAYPGIRYYRVSQPTTFSK